MSVAIAVKNQREVILAADSRRTFGGGLLPEDNLVDHKIRKVGTAYLATTGWGLYGNILDDHLARHKRARLTNTRTIFDFFRELWKQLREHYSLVNDQSGGEDSPFGDLDASFLVINPSGIYYVACDMSVTQFDQYYAIGSGGPYALGALHATYRSSSDPERVARRAVSSACALDVYCGGPTDLVRVKLR